MERLWNECGIADHNRPLKHTTEKALFIGERQVHDFVSNGFKRISFGNKLGENCGMSEGRFILRNGKDEAEESVERIMIAGWQRS